MTETNPSPSRLTRFRRRRHARGIKDVLVYLPRETLAIIADFQARNGLRSRSDAIAQLINERSQSAELKRT